MVNARKKEMSQKDIFIHSFWRGLAAPCMLDAVHYLPNIPTVTFINPPSLPLCHTFGDDWAKIGNDLRKVTHNYVAESDQAKAAQGNQKAYSSCHR